MGHCSCFVQDPLRQILALKEGSLKIRPFWGSQGFWGAVERWMISTYDCTFRRPTGEMVKHQGSSLLRCACMYPLVNIQKAIENYHLQWIYPLKMVIFHSYVKLPEGIYIHIHNPPKSLQKTVNFQRSACFRAAEDLSFRTESKGRFTGNRTSIFGATIAMVSA